jgi:tetratricopeptide (TPR) repeat protein
LNLSSRLPEAGSPAGRRPHIQTAETFSDPVASNSSTGKIDLGELGVTGKTTGEKGLRLRMGASYTPQGKRLKTDESRIGVYGLKNALGFKRILRTGGALVAASALMAASQDRHSPDQGTFDPPTLYEPAHYEPTVDQQSPAPEKKKEWKERAEYELYESVTKSPDPNQWLATLDKWKAQYPQSDFADLRRQLYLASYRALQRPRQIFDAAADVLGDNPNNLVALSAIVEHVYTVVPFGPAELTPQQSADLETAQKAATVLRGNLDLVCSKENRPPDMTEDQVNKAKPALRILAQRAIGYVALERRDYVAARLELTRVLELDPAQGQVSFWLARAILAQNKTNPELQPMALYDFARASVTDGTAALSTGDRQTLSAYLKDVFVKYHGSADGLDQLLALAKSSALPPSGFAIASKSDIEKRKFEAEAELERANPSLGLWKRIRTELQREGGDAYFDASMKGCALPGNVNGVVKFKGKLVGMMPLVRPRELVLAIENPDKPDVTLRLDSALAGKMGLGAEISFEGVADSFSKDPFMVTFTVEKSKIEGWAGKAPAASKKSAAKKAGF